MKLMVKFYPQELAQSLWTFKFIFSRSHGKLFSVLFQATTYISSLQKM